MDGQLVARRRGPGSSPHFEGLGRSVEVVDALVARGGAATRRCAQVDLYLSGLDLPIEIERVPRRASSRCRGRRAGSSIDNDLFALLRAGTDEPDAVAVVCGTGVNAVGRARRRRDRALPVARRRSRATGAADPDSGPRRSGTRRVTSTVAVSRRR